MINTGQYQGFAAGVAASVRSAEEREQGLLERVAELAAANTALEAFTYSVAHDLRAPLRAIEFFGHHLAERTAHMDGETVQAVQRILGANRRMSGMISDLMDFSRVARQDLVRMPVDLSAMVREIAEELVASHPGRNVEWCIGQGLVAHCDPGLVRLVLENLVGNAFKYTRDTPCAVIAFGASTTAAGEREFFIGDNGTGFDMTYAGKLFKAFSRLHGGDRFEGNGIGLATVRRIVERHGGTVRAQGAPGEGAVFSFTLAKRPIRSCVSAQRSPDRRVSAAIVGAASADRIDQRVCSD